MRGGDKYQSPRVTDKEKWQRQCSTLCQEITYLSFPTAFSDLFKQNWDITLLRRTAKHMLLGIMKGKVIFQKPFTPHPISWIINPINQRACLIVSLVGVSIATAVSPSPSGGIFSQSGPRAGMESRFSLQKPIDPKRACSWHSASCLLCLLLLACQEIEIEIAYKFIAWCANTAKSPSPSVSMLPPQLHFFSQQKTAKILVSQI